MIQYEWKVVSEEPYQLQLIHIVSHRPIASVERDGEGKWRWVRNTTVKLQGAPYAEGECDTLEQATISVTAGLPNSR